MRVKFEPADDQTAEKHQGISESDQLLFNPCEDEQNQQWVVKTLLKHSNDQSSSSNTESQQLSCASCFTQLGLLSEPTDPNEKVKATKMKFGVVDLAMFYL